MKPCTCVVHTWRRGKLWTQGVNRGIYRAPGLLRARNGEGSWVLTRHGYFQPRTTPSALGLEAGKGERGTVTVPHPPFREGGAIVSVQSWVLTWSPQAGGPICMSSAFLKARVGAGIRNVIYRTSPEDCTRSLSIIKIPITDKVSVNRKVKFSCKWMRGSKEIRWNSNVADVVHFFSYSPLVKSIVYSLELVRLLTPLDVKLLTENTSPKRVNYKDIQRYR